VLVGQSVQLKFVATDAQSDSPLAQASFETTLTFVDQSQMCADNVVSQAAGMQVQDVKYFISPDMFPQPISISFDVTTQNCPLNFQLEFFSVYN